MPALAAARSTGCAIHLRATQQYIWRGELSDADDFFSPLHAFHLKDELPEVLPFLALPPGWRFLLAPGHEDVWYDETLLDVTSGD